MKAVDKIKKARVQLNDLENGSPFFGHLTMHLDLIQTDEIPTMAVDFNGNLYFNPDFVQDLPQQQVKGVLIHEVMHISLHGKMRKEGRQHQLWNLAQDVIINYIVQQNNFKLPTQRENPETGETENYPVPKGNKITIQDIEINNLENHSFESVYSILQQNQPDMPEIKVTVKNGDQQQEDSQGSGSTQTHNKQQEEDGDKQTENEDTGSNKQEDSETGQGKDDRNQQIKVEVDLGDNPLGIDDHIYNGNENGEESEGKDWEQIMAEATAQAKERGEMPAGMNRRVDNILQPSVSWKTVLKRYISRQISVDYTYQKPSRKTRTLRNAGIKTYLPSTKKEGLNITVALDLSGSIKDKEASHYLGEIKNIANTFEQVNMTLIQHDAQITKTDKFKNVTSSDIENLELKGGGGTSHLEIFQHLQQNNTDIAIMLTDGYTEVPETNPSNTDIIWVINNQNIGEDRLNNIGRIIRTDYHD